MPPAQHEQRTPERQDTERRVLIATRALIDDMRSRYRELEKQTGASISMHRALTCIGAHPGLSATQLAASLGMKKPAVSQTLKALAERGWIDRIRTQADQRSIQLLLTASGRKTLEATAGRAAGTLQRAIGRLSEEELAALAMGVSALQRILPRNPPVTRSKPRG